MIMDMDLTRIMVTMDLVIMVMVEDTGMDTMDPAVVSVVTLSNSSDTFPVLIIIIIIISKLVSCPDPPGTA